MISEEERKRREEFYAGATGCCKLTGYISYSDKLRLLDIAKDNGLVTFDISDAISYVIRTFPT